LNSRVETLESEQRLLETRIAELLDCDGVHRELSTRGLAERDTLTKQIELLQQKLESSTFLLKALIRKVMLSNRLYSARS
jgi:hypothetical protein